MLASSTPPQNTPNATPSRYMWLADTTLIRHADGSADFGDRLSEAAAALTEDVLAPLTDLGIIVAQGADTDTFLQGQLSNDVRELTASHAQFSSYNSAKGRVLALPVLIRRAEQIWLALPRDIVAPTLKRLKMFVLRSKVNLTDGGDAVLALGLAGPNAAAILADAGLPAPEQPWACLEAADVVVVRQPGSIPRFALYGSELILQALWPQLAARARCVGTQAWRLLELQSGHPVVHPETQEQHVAQMLNLDQLDGISFTKGCYPGQEIVARLHYLGNLKRRMFVGYADVAATPRGTAVYLADGSDQPVGEVLDTALHPQHGLALQVVLQLSANEAPLRLGATNGPSITLLR
jgi:tRNA-modifying protein YgfZ